jgi:hypothetical protein
MTDHADRSRSQGDYLLRAPTTTRPTPAISASPLRIGGIGTDSVFLCSTCKGPRSTSFFSWVKENPPMAKPTMPTRIKIIPTIVAAFTAAPFKVPVALRGREWMHKAHSCFSSQLPPAELHDASIYLAEKEADCKKSERNGKSPNPLRFSRFLRFSAAYSFSATLLACVNSRR